MTLMPSVFARFGRHAVATTLSVLIASSVSAQQFIDVTSSRFPVPNLAEWTNQVTIGDLDGDGDLDILFANGGNFSSAGPDLKMRVLINDGAGRFTDQTDARTGGHAGIHRGVELGDCDRDGDLDILLAQDFDRLPGLLINDGSGVFASEGALRLPPITLSSSRGQFGDIDNDGDLDIILPSGTTSRFTCGQYRLYLNDGACMYTDVTATQFPAGNVCNNMDAIFGDIDNDFDIDLRTASTGTANSRLYRNDGTGVFRPIAVPSDSTCYSYDFGDIDGDGDLDMLGANGSSGSQDLLLANDGSGTFTNVSGQISPNPNDDDNDSKFLDYDNDGDLDLLIARIGGAEKLYQNDGSGNFAITTGVFEAVSDSSLDVAVAELTGDGRLDVVTAQGESGNYENRFYLNRGPRDSLAPRIVDTEQLPDADNTVGPYVIRALILDDMTSDRNFFDNGILLNYSVDAGVDQSVPMLHSGWQVYRGELPGQPIGSSVEYWVTAEDRAGNTGIGSSRFFDIQTDCGGVADCSGNGSCIGPDTCECDFGWGGADCATLEALAAGAVPDGDEVAGQPLLLGKVGGGDLTFTWDASCVASDDDFEIYAGSIGDFSTHVPAVCSTGGSTSVTLTPGPGSHYYLVVPRNATREGSYGFGSGAERPAGLSACVLQVVGGCL